MARITQEALQGCAMLACYYNPCMGDTLLGYHEAARIVAKHAELQRAAPRPERVSLAEAAGRILAEPIAADRDQPPFARSARDGFACRAQEASRRDWLQIAGSTRAGEAPGGPLPPDAAWEIMTGGAMPEGADAVAMLEHVEQDGGRVKLAAGRRIDPGENMVARGAQARAGEALLPVGVKIGFAQIALAAACGHASLQVFAKPKVAILPTGDEVVPIEADPRPGEIRNSNGPMLAALVAAAGGEPWLLPAAADTHTALEQALAQAVEADMLLITGGVSAGKFDLVEPVLAGLGAKFHFTGVRIQPGKPLVFGDLTRNGREPLPFFGLPGNPISSAVTFLLFAAPMLAALGGKSELGPRFALAQAAETIKHKPGLTRFLPASCDFLAGETELPQVKRVMGAGSGDLPAQARANCFVMIPEETLRVEAGETVRILLL
jgi:molybdopterin molybdotransferase